MKRSLRVTVYFLMMAILLMTACRNNIETDSSDDSIKYDNNIERVEFKNKIKSLENTNKSEVINPADTGVYEGLHLDDILLLGDIVGGVYINRNLDIKLDGNANNMNVYGSEPDEEYRIYDVDRSDLREVLNAFYEGKPVLDMYACDKSDEYRTVYIDISKAPEIEDLDSYLDEEVEALQEDIQEVQESAKVVKTVEKFVDRELPCIFVSFNEYGVEYYEKTLYIKNRDFIIRISASGYDEEDIKKLFDAFTVSTAESDDYVEEEEELEEFEEEFAEESEEDTAKYTLLSVGEIKDKVYTNTMLDIKLDIRSRDMAFKDLNSLGNPEGMRESIEDLKAYLDEGGTFIDMIAYMGGNKAQITVMITGKDPKESADDYIDSNIIKYKDENTVNMEDIKIEKAEIKFIGKKFPGVSIEGITNNIKNYRRILIIDKGNYAVAVIAVSTDPKILQDTLNNFSRQSDSIANFFNDFSEGADRAADSILNRELKTSKKFTVGEKEGKIYKNKMLGIQFDPKESDFVSYSDKELKEKGYATAEGGDIELIKKSLDAGDTFIDMLSYSKSNPTKEISIIVEKNTENKNMKQYRADEISRLEKEVYNNSPEVKICEGTAKFPGKRVRCVNVDMDSNYGGTYAKRMYVDAGEYIVIITAVGSSEASAQEILGMFKKTGPWNKINLIIKCLIICLTVFLIVAVRDHIDMKRKMM